MLMSFSDDHFIAVFRFKAATSSRERGDDIYYVRERLKGILVELPHTDEVEVTLLSSI